MMEFCNGNIIEIGAGLGTSTLTFLRRAEKTGKKVFVIDPFEDGWNDMPASYGKPYPYESFIYHVREYTEWLTVIKKPSSEVDFSQFKDISFVFVDGLQYKDAVLKDLYNSVSTGAEIICVDDVNRLTGNSEVPLALKEFKSDYKFYNTLDREGYFYK